MESNRSFIYFSPLLSVASFFSTESKNFKINCLQIILLSLLTDTIIFLIGSFLIFYIPIFLSSFILLKENIFFFLILFLILVSLLGMLVPTIQSLAKLFSLLQLNIMSFIIYIIFTIFLLLSIFVSTLNEITLNKITFSKISVIFIFLILLLFVGALFLKLILSITSLLIQNKIIKIEKIDILKGSAEKLLSLIENTENKELNNFLASIAYILSFISPPIVLVLLKKNEFFKFHCIYSLTLRVFSSELLSKFFSSLSFLFYFLYSINIFSNCFLSSVGLMAPSAFSFFLFCNVFNFLSFVICPIVLIYVTSLSMFSKFQKIEYIDNFSPSFLDDKKDSQNNNYEQLTYYLFSPFIGLFLPFFIPILLLFSFLSIHSIIKPYVKKLLEEKIDYKEEKLFENPLILAISLLTKTENKFIEDKFMKTLTIFSLDYHYKTIFRILAYTISLPFLIILILSIISSNQILGISVEGPTFKFITALILLSLIVLSFSYLNLQKSLKNVAKEIYQSFD